MTNRLSLTRKRMRFLYDKLDGYSEGRKLKTKLQGMPVALRINGLAVILTGLASATDHSERFITAILVHWLLQEYDIIPQEKQQELTRGQPNIQHLLFHCLNASRIEYETLQHESMALLEQAKLIAEALWPGEE